MPRPTINPVYPAKPENVGRIPGNTRGNLSGLKPASVAFRIQTTGTLPGSILGNFSNIRSTPDTPYGSVGFSLVCRSATDFTTILAIMYDYTSMGYSEELSGVGAGSVTFDRDDPLIAAQLVNGVDIEEVLNKDNLWEVYFDGKRRFLWLGQNVSEPLISDDESRTVTISGPGIGQALEWGIVLPNSFLGGKEKLADAVRDAFIDQDVDVYGTWVDNGGTVQSVGGKVAVKVTAAGGLGSYLSTAVNYDFVDSGAQAFVEPAIVAGGPGKIRTYLSIEENDTSYARIYTDISPVDNITKVLVAETRGSSGIQKLFVTYSSTSQKYWRVQELDGNAIFSYRAENTDEDSWVTFATLPYSFNPNTVRLRLRADGVSGSNIAFPQTSYFSLVNVDGIGSPIPPFEKFKRLLKKAQSRGTLSFVTPNWTYDADSMGAQWVETPTITVNVGADLLSVLTDICSAQQVDWFMDSDFKINIRQRIWSESGNDPTAPYHKENSVIFYEGESQNSKDRRRTYSGVRNYVVGKTETEGYSVQTDASSISTFQQREVFISDTLSTRDVPSLNSVLFNNLESVKNGASSWSLEVPHNVEGKRLYDDYQLGDWISVQTAFPFRRDTWRIAAISVRSDGDNDPQVELTLNDKLSPYWYKLREDIKRNKFYPKRHFPETGSTRTSPTV